MHGVSAWKIHWLLRTFDQRSFIDGLASSHVDENCSALHAGNGFGVHDPKCSFCDWQGIDNVVTLGHKLVELGWTVHLGNMHMQCLACAAEHS